LDGQRYRRRPESAPAKNEKCEIEGTVLALQLKGARSLLKSQRSSEVFKGQNVNDLMLASRSKRIRSSDELMAARAGDPE
jgi:hypothetical protein